MEINSTHCNHEIAIEEICGKCIIASSPKEKNIYVGQFLATKTKEDIENLVKQIQEDAVKEFVQSKVSFIEEGHRSFWRNGHKIGRTVYQDDKLIGVMDTPELASLVARAVNSYTAFGDDEMLMCTTDDFQSMQNALVKIVDKAEHEDREIYLLAAEALPPKMV